MSSKEENNVNNEIKISDKSKEVIEPEIIIKGTKKSKIKLFLIIASLILIVIVLIFATQMIFCTPKSIFKKSINYIYNQSVDRIDETDEMFEKYDFLEKAITLDFDAVFDTNVEELTISLDDQKIETKDYILGGNIGFDLKDFEAVTGASIRNDEMNIYGNVLFEQGDIYINSNILDTPILVAPISEEELKEYKEEFKKFEKKLEEITSELELDSKSYKYILKAFKNALLKTLNSEKMEKKQSTIEIDGKELKVKKISYKIDEELIEETIDTMVNTLLADDKFIEKTSKITQLDKAKIKDFLRQMKDEAEDIDIDDDVYVNIYVKGLLNQFVGLSFEVEKAGYITYVKTKEKTEVVYYEEYEHYDYDSDEYIEDETKIVLLAEHKSDVTEVSLRHDNETIATADIRSLNSDNIDFDYKAYIDDDFTIGGTLKITQKELDTGVSGKYKFKLEINEEYLSVEGQYELKVSENLEKFNTSNSIKIENIDEETIKNNLLEELKKDQTLYDLIQEAIKEEKLKELLNDYNMYEYESEEDAIALKDNVDATVLFVANSKYSYDYYDDYYNDYNKYYDAWEHLYDLQLEYDFHSYYIHPKNLTDNFWNNYNIEYKCEINNENPELSVCPQMPIIYFMKNGQIVKVLQGSVSYREVKNALEEIGIK